MPDNNSHDVEMGEIACPEKELEMAIEVIQSSTPNFSIDKKTVEKVFEASLDNSMHDAMKKFVDNNGINVVSEEKSVVRLEDFLDQGEHFLNNQEKENKIDSPLPLNTCVSISPVKTPVIPTRKNTNRRVSVPDLQDQSAANSEC